MKPDKEARAHLIRTELADLEREWVEVDGRKTKSGQCYRFDADPVTIMFNTNCPKDLQKKILAIIKKYYL